MRIIILICMLISSQITLAQNSKIEVYGAFDQITLYSNSPLILHLKSQSKFNLGINYQFKTKIRIKPMIGLRYSTLGYKTEILATDLRWPNQIKNGVYDPTIPPPDGAKGLITNVDYPFLEIPIGIRYIFLDSRIKLYGDLGIAPHFIIKKYNQILKNNLKNNIAFNFAVGMDYQLTEQIGLQIRPNLSIQTININGRKNKIVERLYRSGIELGISKNIL